MILSDTTIKKMMAADELRIDPVDEAQIQPASVDIRLGTHYLKIDENAIDLLH